jgi:hypothetical protein
VAWIFEGQDGGTKKLAENFQAPPLNPYMKAIHLIDTFFSQIHHDG